MKIVGIGGGTGLPVLLRGLKQLRESTPEGLGGERVSAAAVVCVSDDGGSSGMLRQAFGIPAVGDLRNCLVALSGGNPVLHDIFQYRLNGASGLNGHSLGNLIVAALHARSGSLRHAIRLASELLDLQGDVLPCTESSVTLCAELWGGETVRGETAIAARQEGIRRIWLDPPGTPAAAGVLETLRAADAIVLGPGSLYTSILPNLFPDGIAEAIRASRALRILVCNLMTQPGETASYTASDHVRATQRYLGPGGLHVCLLNSRAISGRLVKHYAASGAAPVRKDVAALRQCRTAAVQMDVLAENQRRVAHDSVKLARCIVELARAHGRRGETGALSRYAPRFA